MLRKQHLNTRSSYGDTTYNFLHTIYHRYLLLGCLLTFVLSQNVYSADNQQIYDLSLEELMSIKISVVTGKPQRSVEAPGIVSVITAKDIDFWGYQSVAEAINKLPGIYCIDDGLSANCGIRGTNSGFRSYSKVLKVMINGHPVSFRSDGNNYLGPELLPINIVKQIEVIRGPASAVYGANAFLGVVNIITKSPMKDLSGELKITGDRQGGGIVAYYQLQGDTMSLMASLSKASFDRSGTQIPGDLPERSTFTSEKETEDDDSNPLNWFGQATFNLKQHKIEINSHYSRLDSKANFVDFGRFTETGQLNKDVLVSVDSWYLQVKDEWQWQEGLTFNSSIAYSQGAPTKNEKLDVGLADSYPVREFGFKVVDIVAEAQWSLNDSHHFVVGADYSRDKEKLFEAFDIDSQTKIRTQRAAIQSHKDFINSGFYAQYDGNLKENLDLTLNYRLDEQNIYGQNSSYRLGAIYKFTDTLSTKLLYGTSFKAPTAVQLYGQPLFDGEVTGNELLEEESVKTMEAQLNWLLNESINCSINAYQIEASDLVVLSASGFSQKPDNLELQETVGVEAEIQWRGDSNSLSANISGLESKIRGYDILGLPTTTSSELYPRLNSNISWKYSYNSYFDIGLNSRYTSPRRASKSNILLNGGKPYQRPEYKLINLAMNYYYKDMRINLSFKNFLDEIYAEPGFSGIDVPGERRKIQVTFNYKY